MCLTRLVASLEEINPIEVHDLKCRICNAVEISDISFSHSPGSTLKNKTVQDMWTVSGHLFSSSAAQHLSIPDSVLALLQN